MQLIKHLKKYNEGKSKNFTQQDLHKYEKVKYSVEVAVHTKEFKREINRQALLFSTRKMKMKQITQ